MSAGVISSERSTPVVTRKKNGQKGKTTNIYKNGGEERGGREREKRAEKVLFRSKVGDKCLMSPSAYSQARTASPSSSLPSGPTVLII